MRRALQLGGRALTSLAVSGFLSWLFQFWWLIIGGVGAAMWFGASQWPSERIKGERVRVAWSFDKPKMATVIRYIGKQDDRPMAEVQLNDAPNEPPIMVPLGALTFLSWRNRVRRLLPRKFLFSDK